MRGLFVLDDKEEIKPIRNPFAGHDYRTLKNTDHYVLRSQNDDHLFEIQLPHRQDGISGFSLPMDSNSTRRGPASSRTSTSYKGNKPTLSDHEIVSHFPKTAPANILRREQLEQELGMMESMEQTHQGEGSYLAQIDEVKQLFRAARFEAALIELDQMMRLYPTDPNIYEMRGTLLDRLGYRDLALQSWKQSLRLNPENRSLEKFIERRKSRPDLKRGTASQ
jgi:tetratricopeptide (TPR) repeat protein